MTKAFLRKGIHSTWRRASLLCVLLSVCSAGTLPVWAQAPAKNEQRISLALNDADIRDLVLWAQKVVDKTIIIHPSVKGKVTVVAGAPMTREEAYQVFLSTLQVNGFTVLDTGPALKVIPDALVKQNALPSAPAAEAGYEDMQVRVIKVENVPVSQLAALLRPLVPHVGHLAAYPSSNSLIIADRQGNIQKIIDIIDSLDTVGQVDIEMISLEFANAREVADMLNRLLSSRGGKDAEGTGIQLAVDERSNSLLITGDPSARTQIRQLVARLDQPLDGDGNTQVFYLNYTNAADLVPILDSVAGNLKKSTKDKGAAEAEIGIQAAESLNALVVTAPPAVLATIKGVIAKLDKRRAQVLVEALIVEVNEDLSEDFGIEWWGRNTDTTGGFRSFPTSPVLQVDPVSGLSASGGGLSLGYFSGGDLRALINALSTESNANILSTPNIMALDNEEAEILVGSNVPFITGSEDRDNDDPFQTIERQDVGITLKVRPRVNNANSVTLEIEQSVESISQTPLIDAADIITNKREIKTKVLIDNDQILVLGGLIRDEIEEGESRVPVLGHLPLVGRAFKSTSTNTVKRNLMVFIHPVILSDGASSREISIDRYQQIQQNQRDFRDKIENYFVPREVPLLPPVGESESQND